ncbi:MAG: 5-formyltetrahydrofolate cyclo-ligase [Rhodococcus sp.]|nr:5-formyltetrahydrofolate cyclo-ligase [Rhodococcus sp. (in: high G+C Gram-positive bacteria)]
MEPSDAGTDKATWRAEVLRSRRSTPLERRSEESAALVGFVTEADLIPGSRTDTICAYVPLASEPCTLDFLDALRARGARVLVPVTGDPGPLSWAEYGGRDSLMPGPFGIDLPTGDVLEPSEIRSAGIVFVPALAVDRRGVRLGRGAGYYDRTLTLAAPDAPLIAVVRDDELVSELPEDPHDVRMNYALTPNRGLIALT